MAFAKLIQPCQVGLSMPRKCRHILWPALLAVLLGCGDDSQLGRVHGTVQLDGKPLTTGTVRFVPDAGRAAQGEIQPDGTYTLGTYGTSDGALLGTHRVAIVAYEASDNTRPAYEVRTPNRPLVPQKYLATGTSDLSFDVKPGKNRADFDLTSP